MHTLASTSLLSGWCQGMHLKENSTADTPHTGTHRFAFRDAAVRARWAASFKYVYRAPQRALLRWHAPSPAVALHVPVTPAAAAPAPPSFASAPLTGLRVGAKETHAYPASRTEEKLLAAGAQLKALRARVRERSSEQLQNWRGRLQSAAPAGAGQQAMEWLRKKRQCYQLVLQHPLA